MTVLSSELKFYKSKTVSSDNSNGGRMSAVEVISGVVNNVWPHVLFAERSAGSTLHRKLFGKVANDNDESLLDAYFWCHKPTDAGDYVVMFSGTQTDTQADITGSERIYGAAKLHSDVSAGSNTIVVDVEDAAITGIYQDGDKILLTEKTDPTSTTGNEELLTITGAPSVSGSQVTITTVETIANAYTVASGAAVGSLISLADISGSITGWAENSTNGTYDESTYPVRIDNIGSVYQQITLTFTDATHFTAASDDPDITNLPSGDTGTDYAPQNPDFSKPYFTLEAAGWDGTWQAGDTIVFTIVPASKAVWEKRVVPAGTPSFANNQFILAWMGES